jgi:hypothetical protein
MNMKNQGNKSSPKEHNDFPVTYPKAIKIYKLLKKEFKIIALGKFSNFNVLKGKSFQARSITPQSCPSQIFVQTNKR